MSEETPARVVPEYGAAERNAARDMPEDVLRRNVDRLLTQCGRERGNWHPIPDTTQEDMPGAYLYVTEILFLLGIRARPILEDADVATWIEHVKSGEVRP